MFSPSELIADKLLNGKLKKKFKLSKYDTKSVRCMNIIRICKILIIVITISQLVFDLPGTHSAKSALRYGFQRTSECDSYEKVFLCIQKCVDKGYDEVYSDKYCFCTCYVKKEKAKYFPKYSSGTKWKLGTPNTKKPAWIKKLEDSTQKTSPESATIIKKLITEITDDHTMIISKIVGNNETKPESKLEINTSHTTYGPISSDGNETDTVTQASTTNATKSTKESDVSNVTYVAASVKQTDVTNATDIETGTGTTIETDIVKENSNKNTKGDKAEIDLANITDNKKGSNSSNVKGDKIDSDATDDLKLSDGSNTQ